MKAEINEGLLVLIPETKKEMKQIKKFAKNNGATAVIPADRHELAYFYFQDLHIAIV